MGVTYNKTNNLRYTQLCMYIDAHMKDVINTGEHPEIEARIFEYMYHVIYALARKSCFFHKFEDYDAYALYAASEVYVAMHNKYLHEGEEQRGKIIVPVKSCLNFIKTVMFPLKINYQRAEFAHVADAALGHDTEGMLESARESVQADYRNALWDDLEEAIKTIPNYLRRYLARSPFRNDKDMCSKLYISAMLTLLNSITLPQKLRNRLDRKAFNDTSAKITSRFSNSYKANDEEVILWHLDEGFKVFVLVLMRKAKGHFTNEFREIRAAEDFSDSMIDAILDTAYGNVDEGE